VAEYEGVDALLAAITDEPLPEGAHDDAEFMAEHRSALADVALLREQLALIGDALADGAEAAGQAPARKAGKARKRGARKPRNRRPAAAPEKRRFDALAIALGTFAVAVVASMVVGMGWLIAHNGGAGSDDSGSAAQADSKAVSALGSPAYIACSRLIAEGTVAEVQRLPGEERDRITLDVDRSYKPAKAQEQVTFVMDEAAEPRLHQGQHVLVAFRQHVAMPDRWVTGEKEIAREREGILRALPRARGLPCEQ